MNGQQVPQRVQERVGIRLRHLHFPASDVGKLVENLHTDDAARGDGGFRSIRFLRVP